MFGDIQGAPTGLHSLWKALNAEIGTEDSYHFLYYRCLITVTHNFLKWKPLPTDVHNQGLCSG